MREPSPPSSGPIPRGPVLELPQPDAGKQLEAPAAHFDRKLHFGLAKLHDKFVAIFGLKVNYRILLTIGPRSEARNRVYRRASSRETPEGVAAEAGISRMASRQSSMPRRGGGSAPISSKS